MNGMITSGIRYRVPGTRTGSWSVFYCEKCRRRFFKFLLGSTVPWAPRETRIAASPLRLCVSTGSRQGPSDRNRDNRAGSAEGALVSPRRSIGWAASSGPRCYPSLLPFPSAGLPQQLRFVRLHHITEPDTNDDRCPLLGSSRQFAQGVVLLHPRRGPSLTGGVGSPRKPRGQGTMGWK